MGNIHHIVGAADGHNRTLAFLVVVGLEVQRFADVNGAVLFFVVCAGGRGIDPLGHGAFQGNDGTIAGGNRLGIISCFGKDGCNGGVLTGIQGVGQHGEQGIPFVHSIAGFQIKGGQRAGVGGDNIHVVDGTYVAVGDGIAGQIHISQGRRSKQQGKCKHKGGNSFHDRFNFLSILRFACNFTIHTSVCFIQRS